METNYELPKNTYVGFGSIGGSKREREEDPLDDLENSDEPKEEKQVVTEAEINDHIPELGNKTTNSAKYLLQDYSKGGQDHKSIMDAARHIKSATNIEADANLDHVISSAPKLTPEIHEHVRQTLRANHNDVGLHAKYSWVFEHPDTHTEPPEYNEHNREHLYVDEDHIRKYKADGFQFKGGRTIVDSVTGSRHHLNHDGSISPIGRKYEQEHVDTPPFADDGGFEAARYHHDMLSHHFDRQIHDRKDTPEHTALAHYTEDSVPYNKATVYANRGQKIPNSVKIYIGHDSHEKAKRLDSLLKDVDPYPASFTAYTGLSRSADPTKHEETSPGRKTGHFPAFTSTSLHASVAQDFSRQKSTDDLGDVRDIVKLKVPKYHSGGAYVDGHSTNSGEMEYILTHGHVIEHDAKPKYYFSGRQMYRVWDNGVIKGINQHQDWKHLDTKPEDMTPEVTKHMESSHIPPVSARAVMSSHASEDNLMKTIKSTIDPKIVRSAITNHNLKSDSLKKILDTTGVDSDIHFAAMSNPHYNEDHATTSLAAYPSLAQEILSHPSVPRHVALMASSHPSSHLRKGAILSGKLHDSEIAKMADDAHPEVAKIAKIAMGKTEEYLNSLITKATVAITG